MIIYAQGSTSCFWATCYACLQEISANTSICSQMQCCWQIFINFLLPPPLRLVLLSCDFFLDHLLISLLVNMFLLHVQPAIVFLFVFWPTNYESTCALAYKCVLICTCGYEFPPTFKHVPTYKNPPENDAITPKLHNKKCLSSSQQNRSLL
jgi:hypothetical protein